MKFKIAIEKDGKQYYADADKVFNWLFERYTKYQGRKTGASVLPYDKRVDSFFDKLSLEGGWLSEMRKAFPGINIKNELDKAKAWLLSNKAHKKDLKKFCYNWVARANPTQAIAENKTRGQVERQRKEFDSNTNIYNDEDCVEPKEIGDILKNYMKGKE